MDVGLSSVQPLFIKATLHLKVISTELDLRSLLYDRAIFCRIKVLVIAAIAQCTIGIVSMDTLEEDSAALALGDGGGRTRILSHAHGVPAGWFHSCVRSSSALL